MIYIVLPFKDRNGKYKNALDEFINPFIEYINNNLTDYEILIVEQAGGSIKDSLPKEYEEILNSVGVSDDEFFNLGRTINIGYDIIKDRVKDDDIFMFHPVDLIPIEVNYLLNKTTRICPDFPEWTDHHKSIYYKSIAFLVSDFKKVNGFSNNYWGWGLEDDDIRHRLSINNIDTDLNVGKYLRLTNDGNGLSDSEHYIPLYQNNQKYLYEHFSISGLNNLSYKLISTEEYNSINKYIIE